MRTRNFVAATVAVSLLMLSGCGSTDAVVQSQAVPSVAPGAPAPPPFSQATKSQVEERAGITFVSIDPKAKPPTISLARAMQAADENFTGILRGKQAAEAQYGLVTNSRTGPLRADGSIKPSIDRQLMWLLFYRGIEMAVSSNVERVNDPLLEHGDFLIYVDATTGDVPGAETV